MLGKTTLRWTLAGFALASVANLTRADSLTIVVAPSLAPNALGSPSFSGYQSNALYALENGLSSYGDPTSPTYYQKITAPMSLPTAIVTGFPSWMGNADVQASYAGEYGNRVTFGVDIVSHAGKFSISQLSFSSTTDDATNSLGLTYGPGSYTYSAAYVGIDFGGDGKKGGGDDHYITSGANTQLVDEIVGRGSGCAWATYLDPLITNQQNIDNLAASVWSGSTSNTLSFTGTYSINGASGSATVLFNDSPTQPPDPNATPLPGAAGAGTLLLSFTTLTSRRRRRAQRA
jgi:hypothetical protein